MNISECEIGMRIFCPEHFECASDFAGMTGTIVSIEVGDYVGVEWDTEIPYGHDCNGSAKKGHGYFGYANEIEPYIPYEASFGRNLRLTKII